MHHDYFQAELFGLSGSETCDMEPAGIPKFPKALMGLGCFDSSDCEVPWVGLLEGTVSSRPSAVA